MHTRIKTTYKAPPLRFRPGNFVRRRKHEQLYCVVRVHRLISNPSEWLYLLEERDTLKNPSTPLSIACEKISGKSFSRAGKIIWEAIDKHDDRIRFMQLDDYGFGDRIIETNKTMMQQYELVSSGEIELV